MNGTHNNIHTHSNDNTIFTHAVNGPYCECAPNYFGANCAQYVEADPTRSFSALVIAGQSASIGSLFDSTQRGFKTQLQNPRDRHDKDKKWVQEEDEERTESQEMRDEGKRHEKENGWSQRNEGRGGGVERGRRATSMGTRVAIMIPSGALMETVRIRARVFPLSPAVLPWKGAAEVSGVVARACITHALVEDAFAGIHVYVFVCIFLCIYESIIYVCTYMHMYMYVCTYVFIYI